MGLPSSPEVVISYIAHQKRSESQIFLVLKPSNRNWLTGGSELTHPEIRGRVQVEDHSIRPTGFKFSIFAECIDTSHPILRFDADGPAHRNAFEGVPLTEQKISTPHFHRILADGRTVAYRGEVDNIEQQLVLQDVQSGFNFFCKEANIYDDDGSFPRVGRDSKTLNLEVPLDPLAEVRFISL